MNEHDERLTHLVEWGLKHKSSDILIEEGLNRSIQGLRYKNRFYYDFDYNITTFIDFIVHKAQLSMSHDVAQSQWMEVWTENGFINIRVSYLKTINQRFLTLRLIQDHVIELNKILHPLHLNDEKRIKNLSHGLVCFIGLAGSGKSTTLRAFLHLIRDKRIISIEHPIEYHMSFMMQIEQHHHDIETMVYHALRHHPHVLVIEEVRNAHELKVAYEASLSGHLVCITFHATNVESAKQRMKSMIHDFQFNVIQAWFVQKRKEIHDDVRYEVAFFENEEISIISSTT
ncbi:MAG: Flp pilus assembly complex ATPase component TadA [Erysipelothrix sp.]|jgi:type II secretory ATPase GspE/PulE/Tfp pilus assembly ATPase PilB-like protein|nr:Flp pilus assembly complex ATPase component TadA [Erysipelothrix sp.]